MTSGTNALGFPDGPKLEFEVLLDQLIGRAHEVMSTQVRLRHLVAANNAVVSDLDLQSVLTRIAETARELVGAKYAAIGIIGPNGNLDRFIHVGMDAAMVAKIGPLPEGKGLLGALIQDPKPILLKSILSDPRSSGFPEHHPTMESFLGVPIHVRDEIYGNLYLTDHERGEFSPDDQVLAGALAATAGVAIANARLFEESTYRERLATILASTTRRMLADDENGAIDFMVEGALEIAQADLVCVGLASADHEHVVVDRVLGLGADRLAQATFPLTDGAIKDVLERRELRVVDDIRACPPDGLLQQSRMGQAIVVPFDINSGQDGALIICRAPGRLSFLVRDHEMANAFANQLALAVERTATRSHHQYLEQLEDRNRIARDLHDHVIQRLFAAGLSLQAVAGGLGPGEASRRITAQISDIDDTIAQIRESIFALKDKSKSGSSGLRSRVREVIDRVSDQLPSAPKHRFLGPVDLMSNRELTDDVVAVVTEALANIVRHADAASVSISVAAAEGEISVEVIDDGIGIDPNSSRSGLSNLRERAEQRHGNFEVHTVAPHGTRLLWSVPV